MDFAAIQNQRRLHAVLKRKRDEARQREKDDARAAAEAEEARKDKERLDAIAKTKRQVEAMLVTIEQGIRTFGYVPGVTTSDLRAWFAKTYTGGKLNAEIFSAALKKGIEDRRLKYGERRGKLDINSFLINVEVGAVIALQLRLAFPSSE